MNFISNNCPSIEPVANPIAPVYVNYLLNFEAVSMLGLSGQNTFNR